MPRLIDKDEALKRLTWDSFAYQEINMMESVDAEPVVRCKDCKYADETAMCGYVTWYNKEDDFCSWGERKEDETDPVRHGHWINHFDDLFPEESTQECSVCHAEQMGTMLNDNYCPNCGAKMDEEGKDA